MSPRLDAIRVWRAAKVPQWIGDYINNETGARCAIGLLVGEEASTDLIACDWIDAHLSDVWGIPAPGEYAARLALCPLGECRQRTETTGLMMVAHWNDAHELTFAQIADLAEQHPELVFVDGVRP